MQNWIGILLLISILGTGCKKEEEISVIPAIEFESFSSNVVQAAEDSLVIQISYKDGDGDLGENNGEVKNCFVKDLRNEVVYQFRIPQLAPTGENIAIQGTFEVVLDRVPLIDPNQNTESVNFEVYVRDRSGNESNRITTPAVQVNR
jgi:hypothetical protein